MTSPRNFEQEFDYRAAISLLRELRCGAAGVRDVKNFLERSKDVDAIRFLLTELPLFGGDAEPYKEFYRSCARGLDFDGEDFLKIAALSVINRVIPDLAEVSSEIGKALNDPNPVLRETAAAAVQMYLGVPVPNLDWGDGTGNVGSYAEALARWNKIGRHSLN